MVKRIRQLLSDPYVLTAAWKRVQTWYRFDELKPEPEYSSWLMRTEEHLSELSSALAAGTFRPQPFNLVPYPKSGAILRHYALPCLRDQVAFTCYAILLAPILESRMANFSFGNRWYRGIYMSQQDQSWKFRPYTLLDNSIYQPSRRSHGLFRRVSHWTAARMVETPADNWEELEWNEYPTTMLPKFIQTEWWQNSDHQQGHWCQLDLQLAYPSVRIDKLNNRLETMLAVDSYPSRSDKQFAHAFSPDHEAAEIYASLGGYPSQLRSVLSFDEKARLALANELCGLLSQVTYQTEIPGDFWLPPHTDQQLPITADQTSHPGLPTGLLISGLLMNCYLNNLDVTMGKWMLKQRKQSPAAYMRFADDMLLLCAHQDDLFAGLDEIWLGLTGDRKSVLGVPAENNPANLRLNWGKIQPEGFGSIVKRYLDTHGITKCQCGHFKREREPSNILPLREWWHANRNDADDQRKLRKSSIEPGRLGPFVTNLVERLSDMGRDDSADRFGQAAKARLDDLHNLVRIRMDDRQVKADTRLLFAAHRLVRAWLPDETSDAVRSEINQIRQSVQEAVLQAPWKFQLWTTVVRAACRRPFDTSNELDDLSAQNWLNNILHVIAYDSDSPRAWLKHWPEDELDKQCRKDALKQTKAAETWKHYYLSFLRTYFWRSIAETIRTLSYVADQLAQQNIFERASQPTAWSSESWVFRTLSEHHVAPVRDWLGQLEGWYQALYGDSTPSDLNLANWEIDAIALAYLASFPQGDVATQLENFQDSLTTPNVDNTTTQLAIPFFAAKRNRRLRSLLERNQRTTHAKDPLPASIDPWIWFRLSSYQESARSKISSLLSASDIEASPSLLSIAQVLSVSQSLPLKIIDHWRTQLHSQLRSSEQLFSMNVFELMTYGRAREVVLSIPHPPAKREIPIQQLVWGAPWISTILADWKLSWCHVPQVGLPLRVATSMLQQILNAVRQSAPSQTAAYPQTWTIDPKSCDFLAIGRRLQLSIEPDNSLDLGQTQSVLVNEKSFSDENIPHPSFLLPIVQGLVKELSKKYRLWCALLTFLSIADGSERILDTFFHHGLGVVPFNERWDMRGRIHLPLTAWQVLDRTRRWFADDSGWKDQPKSKFAFLSLEDIEIRQILSDLLLALEEFRLTHDYQLRDFRWQRTDTTLELANQIELAREVSSWTPAVEAQRTLPQSLTATRSTLVDEISLRIAQVQADVDWRTFLPRFPRLSRVEIQDSLRQISAAFETEKQSAPSSSPRNQNQTQLIIFPEVTLPASETRVFKQLVHRTGTSGLIGTQLRPLLPMSIFNRFHTPPFAFIVNEALFATPLMINARTGTSMVRDFFIRKPIPSHIELGLASALTDAHTTFVFLRGTHWYRFVHPAWGDFTVSICADLLDPTPWISMQGQLLHLFMCAHNDDVDLYEHLTWVRAYENYVNVVSTNHGSRGGSFAWSPQRKYARQIASLRGNNMFILADVTVPVRDLWLQQISGTTHEIKRADARWRGLSQPKNPVTKVEFKAPPPGFRQRQDPDVV